MQENIKLIWAWLGTKSSLTFFESLESYIPWGSLYHKRFSPRVQFFLLNSHMCFIYYNFFRMRKKNVRLKYHMPRTTTQSMPVVVWFSFRLNPFLQALSFCAYFCSTQIRLCNRCKWNCPECLFTCSLRQDNKCSWHYKDWVSQHMHFKVDFSLLSNWILVMELKSRV